MALPANISDSQCPGPPLCCAYTTSQTGGWVTRPPGGNTHATMLQPLADGLTTFATCTGDKSDVDLGAQLYLRSIAYFQTAVTDHDHCDLAFPTVFMCSGLRTPAFVAVLTDRLLISWSKGVFRKTV